MDQLRRLALEIGRMSDYELRPISIWHAVF